MIEPTRRDLLRGVGVAGVSLAAGAALANGLQRQNEVTAPVSRVSFRGLQQAGIITPPPEFLEFFAFDLATSRRHELHQLLNDLSDLAARLVAGQPAGSDSSPSLPPRDSGEALDLGASSLTITIGYGPRFFERDETAGLTRPRRLRDLPNFVGDDLQPQWGGGDIIFQVCSSDPQVNFHAVHSLERESQGRAHLRYWHRGFGRTSAVGQTQRSQRNLLGFKDGTNNLRANEQDALHHYVWVNDPHEPTWMQQGTYLVHRKIRTFIETWSAQSLDTQEAVIGRFRASGAPLTGTAEHDVPDLHAVDQYGNFVIPDSAHIRAAAPATNHGVRILRRGFSYADGLDPRSGQYDAGLHFICFQKDPLAQFAAIQETLAQNDALMNYLTHVASSVAACPRGLRAGQGWGDQLFG